MKKFLFLHYGYETPTKEIMEAWGAWFELVGDKVVDPGSPLISGREITHSGTKEVSRDAGPTGYMIVEAENMDEAEKIAQSCPIVSGLRFYETRDMQGQ
jgi:hypothetical protein